MLVVVMMFITHAVMHLMAIVLESTCCNTLKKISNLAFFNIVVFNMLPV